MGVGVLESIESLGRDQDSIKENHRVLWQRCHSALRAEMAKKILHMLKVESHFLAVGS